MGAAAYAICFQVSWEASGLTAEKMAVLLGALGMGVLVYGGTCYFFGMDEIHSAMGLVRRKFGRLKRP
jgi:hypothetical protein